MGKVCCGGMGELGMSGPERGVRKMKDDMEVRCRMLVRRIAAGKEN